MTSTPAYVIVGAAGGIGSELCRRLGGRAAKQAAKADIPCDAPSVTMWPASVCQQGQGSRVPTSNQLDYREAKRKCKGEQEVLTCSAAVRMRVITFAHNNPSVVFRAGAPTL